MSNDEGVIINEITVESIISKNSSFQVKMPKLSQILGADIINGKLKIYIMFDLKYQDVKVNRSFIIYFNNELIKHKLSNDIRYIDTFHVDKLSHHLFENIG